VRVIAALAIARVALVGAVVTAKADGDQAHPVFAGQLPNVPGKSMTAVVGELRARRQVAGASPCRQRLRLCVERRHPFAELGYRRRQGSITPVSRSSSRLAASI